MRIDELDEWQGVTPDMVREWLLASGWTQPNTSDLARWENGADVMLFDPDTFDQMPFWATTLARVHGLNTQAVLRMINPRMRKGMPSEAARAAHPLGLWLALPDFDCIGAKVSIVVSLTPDDDDDFGMWHPEGFSFASTKPKHPDLWMFWPCDEHGNKVRWPTDDKGEML